MAKKTSSEKPTVVILDAHAILHRAYHALPDFTANDGTPTGALYGTVTMLLKIIEEFRPHDIVACYDLPEPTYRHDAYAEYKGTRSKTDEALVAQIERSREVMQVFGIRIFESPGFEADDVLGTIAKQIQTAGTARVIIASGDMDTLQCVVDDEVQVYTLKKGIKDTILYNEAAVRERFGFGPEHVVDYKGLRGDASDNIPGIRGIGDKTATDLITQFGSIDTLYNTVHANEQALLDAGIKARIIRLLKEGEEEAQFSRMLATIRTDAPVAYQVPATAWGASLQRDDIQTLFSELSFRTLGTRVDALLFTEQSAIEPESAASALHETDDEIEQTALALWLLESDTTNPTYEDILSYGRAHGIHGDFTAIREAIFTALKLHDLEWVYTHIEVPLRTVIKHMQDNGIALDVQQFTSLSQTLHTELAALEADIHRVAGVTFNLNSPKQLGDVLYDTLGLKPKNAKKTAGGQRSTRESELEKMRDDHPIIEQILRYREVQKLVSTYVDPLPTMLGEDGRLHTTFLQAGTTTGRMASRDPNLQNIPTRTEESKLIRKGFVAAPGFQLVSIDYSQIELRIAAILSGDHKLIDIFRRGEDVHTGVAVRVFGVHASDVTSEMRRKAKVINFGILYGMGVNALRSNLGTETSRAEAQEFLNAYFQTFTRLAEYLEEVKETARRTGYTTTLFGRRRYFPGLTSSLPHIRAQAERMAINAPIQGTAADSMKIAMNKVYQKVTNTNQTGETRLLLQVHDELVFEIADSLIDTQIPVLEQIMCAVLDERQTHDVPIVVDTAVGSNWGELAPYSSHT